MPLLVQWGDNFLDEVDVSGFYVTTGTKEQYINDLIMEYLWDEESSPISQSDFDRVREKHKDNEFYFNTGNYGFRYKNFEHFVDSIRFDVITDEEAVMIKRLFGARTFGLMPL